MKKVYDIKIKDLEEILKQLKENMYDSTTMMDAIRLEDYIKRIKNEFRPTDDISVFEQLQDDLEFHSFYKPLYPFIERFIFTGRTVDELNSSMKYQSVIFTDEQVVADVMEFYGHQGTLFHSQLLDYYDELEYHLKFINTVADTDGESLFLKSIGEAFVFVPNYSNVTKFTILIHELQHVIDFFINPSFSEEFVIRETIAMFMEMLACDYIAKKYNLYSEGFKRQQYLHAILKYNAHNVMYKTDILDIAEEHKGLNETELNSLLNKEGFDCDDLNFYFEQGIVSEVSYQISYLIAIELYMIYYKDKELALKICEDIIKYGTSDNILELLDKYGIKLNSNVVNYENKIYKKRY